MKFLSLTFLMSFTLVFSSLAQAIETEASVDSDNFSVQETRNFTSLSEDSVSNVKMSLAQVPDEFDCPLFSNSPYKDILTAIDGLQTSINVFPKCSASDKTNELMSTSSVELRQKILEAQNLQKNGEIHKLGLSAEQILEAATKLQDLISKVTSSSEGDCYKSEESKKLIFSINDTFQSIAPLALDFAAKNPTLGPILAQYLPVVAGTKALSKGISILEFALKYVPTLDMKVPENRMAVIKNTCSFMKLYNKVEYLTLDRASRIKKINQDFDNKIKISREIKKNVLQSLGGMVLSTNPVDAEIINIKDRIQRYQSLLGQASEELGLQNKESDISTCSVVKTLYNMKTSPSLLADLIKLSVFLQKTDQVAFKQTKLLEFEAEMNKPNVLKDSASCSAMGQQWILAQKEALDEMKLILSDYDHLTQTSAQESVAKIKISREDKKTADLQANKAKLNIFADISVFEPGELEKRMRGMPRYLFNGPDGSWYSKLKKNGPVYDLLHDNEQSFQIALEKFKTAVAYLLNFEYRMYSQEMENQKLKSLQAIDPVFKKLTEESSRFRHLTTGYAPVGSYEHRQLCDKSKLAIKAYVEATDHLMSNEYLCKMIDPVLKEVEVSIWLRRYCQNSKGFVINTDVKAGYKEVARPLFVKNGPKQQVEVIMQKYNQLSCD